MTIGKPVDRIDGPVKVRGLAPYVADWQLPNMLYAVALRSRVASGRIQSILTTKAKNAQGVVDVLTHLDADRLGWHRSTELDAIGAEGLGRTALADEASEMPAYLPLVDEKIHFAGQWIAVIVGNSIESARDGLALIDVRFEAEGLVDPVAIEPGPFFGAAMQHKRDDAVETGGEAARLRARYETPLQLHQPMEPSATTAIWEGGSVLVYDSTQGVQASRDYIARSLAIDPDRVKVVAPFVGGGFGAKNQVWPHQALAAHIARAFGRPTRLQLSRADMAVASGYRSETLQDIELAADASGRLIELGHHSQIPTSLRGGFFEPCGLNSLMLYKSARIKVSHKVVRRPIATPTPFRAPGETPGSFALESALDELAFQLRIDPIELRIRNFAEKDSYHDRAWSSNKLLQCYHEGASRFGWISGPVKPRSLFRDGLTVGQGMAATAYPAPALAASARIILQAEGKLRLETSATDIGTGMRTIVAQTASDMMGIPLDAIQVVLGDSSLPNAPTAGRSKSTASVLPAVANACLSLMKLIDGLDPQSGNLPNAIDPFARLERIGRSELKATGHAYGAPASGDRSHYSFGAHFVEVEFDELIRRLRISRIVSVLDCGRIVNPKLAASQIRGGIVFGIGMALMENGKRHPRTLRPLADNLADYAVPVHADMPQIDIEFIDAPDPSLNELGVRGLGEIGLPGVAAAISNAVFHATGHRFRKLPIDLHQLAALPA